MFWDADVIGRIAAAVALGAVVGFEREAMDQPAGLRTHITVCLGACLFGVPAARVDPLRRAFGLPDALTPVGAVTVGHPDPDGRTGGSARSRARRPLDDVVHRGRWRGDGTG